MSDPTPTSPSAGGRPNTATSAPTTLTSRLCSWAGTTTRSSWFCSAVLKSKVSGAMWCASKAPPIQAEIAAGPTSFGRRRCLRMTGSGSGCCSTPGCPERAVAPAPAPDRAPAPAPAPARGPTSSVSPTAKATGCNTTWASRTGFCGTVVPGSVRFHPGPGTLATRMRHVATRLGASRAPATPGTQEPACHAQRWTRAPRARTTAMRTHSALIRLGASGARATPGTPAMVCGVRTWTSALPPKYSRRMDQRPHWLTIRLHGA
mmetsp:Transcript_54737/g.127969  ORF Transcript_54737/g.127969 Transcript_54737/m.127969 type:complete len:262 (+) Transcript_54737:839-1624(+)